MRNDTFSAINLRKLDLFEQIVVTALYLWFITRLWPGSFSDMSLYVLLLIISESVVVVLLLFRKPTETISIRPFDWLVAFCGSFLPLVVSSGGEPLMPRLGTVLLFWGLMIHVGAKLSLLRSFGLVAANRGIKVKGLYAFIRHPMYAGYFITHLGFLLAAPSLWNVLIYICCWSCFLTRIFAEESLLIQSSEYQKYMNRVPYRILPGVF